MLLFKGDGGGSEFDVMVTMTVLIIVNIVIEVEGSGVMDEDASIVLVEVGFGFDRETIADDDHKGLLGFERNIILHTHENGCEAREGGMSQIELGREILEGSRGGDIQGKEIARHRFDEYLNKIGRHVESACYELLFWVG